MGVWDRIPKQIFSTRGWGLLAAGVLCLLAAQVLGRRDLLSLALLLLILPLLSLAGTRVLKPRFSVYREFDPSPVQTSAAVTVRLAVARTGPGTGHALMEEQLPPRFGQSPVFRFPARTATAGSSRYEYQLRSATRGQFVIGPVTAEFSDPFGLSVHRHAIDAGDVLTVTPAPVYLPPTSLAGARGHDGVTATRSRANPSDDDVMTREYRHGDPMRRVHWAATARHGELMVRQEESVTTPEATVILDHRYLAHSHGTGYAGPADGLEPVSSDSFEWAVTAAMSVCAHLGERSYALRCLDPSGEAAFLHSPSAPEPHTEEFLGAAGLQSIAESLAAIGLTGPRHPGGDAGPRPFDDRLLDKLSAHRLRGPVLAILGRLTPAEARDLAPAAAFGANAFALVAAGRGAETEEALAVLRRGGWRAVAVSPATALPAAWSAFDDDGAAPEATAADARRGAGARR